MFEQIIKDYPNADGFMNVIVSNNIEIYGEEHNQKITSTSIYSKIVQFLNKKKLSKDQPLVLLEHPSSFCKFQNKNEIKNFRKYGNGGIYYLFLKLIQSYPSIRCIDTRIELGYLMALQERELESSIEHVETIKEVYDCYQIMSNLRDQFKRNEQYYTKHEILYRLYLENVKEIDESLNKVLLYTHQYQNIKTRAAKIKKMKLLKENLTDLFFKCRNLSSFSVDVYIISILLHNPEQKIFVFCGNRHLFRLFFFLKIMTNIKFQLINEQGKVVKITTQKPLKEHFTNWQNIDYSI
jgi:hypothetical protein